MANNPTLDGLTEFALYNEALRHKNRLDEMESLGLVLSLGTGRVPVKPRESSIDLTTLGSFNLVKTYKNAIVAKDILLMVLDEATGTEGHVVDRAMAWCHGINVPYFRISTPLSEDLQLDETDDVEVINSMWETKAYIHAMDKQVTALVDLLELTVPPVAKDLRYNKPFMDDMMVAKLVEAKAKVPDDDVKETIKETKQKVKDIIQKGGTGSNMDKCGKLKSKQNDECSSNRGGKTNSASYNQLTRRLSDSDDVSNSSHGSESQNVRRDFASDVKHRDTTLVVEKAKAPACKPASKWRGRASFWPS